jgi:phosphate-selective porin OprO/OprP
MIGRNVTVATVAGIVTASILTLGFKESRLFGGDHVHSNCTSDEHVGDAKRRCSVERRTMECGKLNSLLRWWWANWVFAPSLIVSGLLLAASALGEAPPDGHDIVFASTPMLLAKRPQVKSLPPVDQAGALELDDALAAEQTGVQYLTTAWRETPDSEMDASAAGGDSEEEKSVSERLEELERNYSDLQASHDELKDSLEHYATSGHDGSTMEFGGRIHVDMWQYPGSSPGVNGFETGDNDITPADRLLLRRIRFGARGDLWYNMLYRIDFEFAGGNDLEFRDVYLGFTELPVLQKVYIGNQKRPYGLDTWNSSRYTIFLERPFVVEAFNQDARRLGIQSWSHSEDMAWNWQYGVFNQRLIQDEGDYTSDHWQAQVAGRLANTIWWDECSDGRGYAHWAISGTWANTDPNQLTENYADNGISEARFRTRPEARTVERWLDTGVIPGAEDYSLLGLEKVINVGPLQISGEYQNVWLNRQTDSQLHFHGGYIYVAYFLTGEHMPWDRETGQLDRPVPFENFFLVDTCRDGVRGGCGAWQVAGRWSYGDLSDDGIQGGIGENFTFSLSWLWNPWAKMQFNYIYGNIHDNALNAVGGIDFGDYHILGTRFMIDF